MTVQCNAARFLFIDEIEATGADTLGAMEEKILHHTSLKAPWRYKDKDFPRLFGGMNVCFFGDFWQLSPTGQISIMSDVTAPKVLENARAHHIMNVFWDSTAWDTLQPWSSLLTSAAEQMCGSQMCSKLVAQERWKRTITTFFTATPPQHQSHSGTSTRMMIRGSVQHFARSARRREISRHLVLHNGRCIFAIT